MRVLRQALRRALDAYTDDRALWLAIVLSSAAGLLALALGLRLVGIAAAVLLPWAPHLVRRVAGGWARYGWLALFELVVILQLGHFGEHLSQMAELHLLNWPMPWARGIVGELDIEPVHFWWNLIILTASTLLLFPYRRNRWLWASFLFSIWHQLEHTYIYFAWFLPKGISGHPGILGAGGLLDQANLTVPVLTDLSRPDLHFWYNLFEIGLFLVAFLVQVRGWAWPLFRPVTARASPGRYPSLAWAVGGVEVLFVLGLALYLYSPRTLRVPENYPTIQAAIAGAPDWGIIRIAPGSYAGPFEIGKPLTLIGDRAGGTILLGRDDDTPTIAVHGTHDVALQHLTVRGGLYGILVEESQAVQVTDSRILRAWFAGIRLSRASAEIRRNEVRGMRSPYGMGIEMANTVSRPPSLIQSNLVADNPHEGIVLHNAAARIERNTVTGNGLRGIAITEMSMATIRGNQVSDNADAGILIIDNSMADILSNQVSAVRPGPNGAADGIRAYYYAEATLGSNTILVAPPHAIVVGYNATVDSH